MQCSETTKKGLRCKNRTLRGVCHLHKSKRVKAKLPAKPKEKKSNVHDVIFAIKYTRSNDGGSRDPTPIELERYVAASTIIPENPTYKDFRIIDPVTYIGKLKFHFTCETSLSPKKIADAFLSESLADGEWEAPPGDGSFVYPTKDGKEELGLLSFAYVVVDGKKFKGR